MKAKGLKALLILALWGIALRLLPSAPAGASVLTWEESRALGEGRAWAQPLFQFLSHRTRELGFTLSWSWILARAGAALALLTLGLFGPGLSFIRGRILSLVLAGGSLFPLFPEGFRPGRASWDLSFALMVLRQAGSRPLVLGPGPLAPPLCAAGLLREGGFPGPGAEILEEELAAQPEKAARWLLGRSSLFLRGDLAEACLAALPTAEIPALSGRWLRGRAPSAVPDFVPAAPASGDPAFSAYLVLEADAALAGDGNTLRAGRLLERAEGGAGKNARLWALIAWGWSRCGEAGSAARAALRAHTLDRRKIEYLLASAQALDKAGQEDLADAYLMEALGLEPANAAVLEARAGFFLRHDPGRAAAFLEAAKLARAGKLRR